MVDELHQAQIIPGNEALALTQLLDKLFSFPYLQRQPVKTDLDRLKRVSAHTSSVATLSFCALRLHYQYIIRLVYRKNKVTLKTEVIEIG